MQRGEESTGQRRVLKTYTVFNVEQIDNLPDRFLTPPQAPRILGDTAHQSEIDAFIAASGARIIHGGNQACYRPAADVINLPHAADFDSYADYGATAAHELAHWTGHPTRLNRDLGNRFGDEKYAAEELIAEFASALIGADLGLPVTHLDSHASYIGHWLKIPETRRPCAPPRGCPGRRRRRLPPRPRRQGRRHHWGRRRGGRRDRTPGARRLTRPDDRDQRWSMRAAERVRLPLNRGNFHSLAASQPAA